MRSSCRTDTSRTNSERSKATFVRSAPDGSSRAFDRRAPDVNVASTPSTSALRYHETMVRLVAALPSTRIEAHRAQVVPRLRNEAAAVARRVGLVVEAEVGVLAAREAQHREPVARAENPPRLELQVGERRQVLVGDDAGDEVVVRAPPAHQPRAVAGRRSLHDDVRIGHAGGRGACGNRISARWRSIVFLSRIHRSGSSSRPAVQLYVRPARADLVPAGPDGISRPAASFLSRFFGPVHISGFGPSRSDLFANTP